MLEQTLVNPFARKTIAQSNNPRPMDSKFALKRGGVCRERAIGDLFPSIRSLGEEPRYRISIAANQAQANVIDQIRWPSGHTVAG